MDNDFYAEIQKNLEENVEGFVSETVRQMAAYSTAELAARSGSSEQGDAEPAENPVDTIVSPNASKGDEVVDRMAGQSATTEPIEEQPISEASAPEQPDGPNMPITESAAGNDTTLQIQAEDMAELRQAVDSVSKEVAEIKKTVEVDILKQYSSIINDLKLSVASNLAHEESMHKELELARKDEHFVTIRPFISFIVELHAEYSDTLREYEEDSDNLIASYTEKGYKEIVDMISYNIDKISGELSRQGVEILDYDAGTEFITTEQTVMKKTEPTTDEALVGKIARVISSCYKYGDKVLKKAKVSLYKIEK